MRAAIIDSNNIVTNVVVLDFLEQLPGAVLCPEHIGVGMNIEDPPPLDIRTPEQVKVQAIAQIDKQRDETIDAGFIFNGKLFHADALFQTQLQAFVLAFQTGILPPGATVSIRRKDNVTVQLGQVEIIALAAGLMQYVQTIYAQSWVAKDELQ